TSAGESAGGGAWAVSSGDGQPRSARYASRYFTTNACTTAARGIATIAPIAPASCAPSRNAKVTTIGWSWSAPARTSGARMFSSTNQPTSIRTATITTTSGRTKKATRTTGNHDTYGP